jgi:hypothetical protein
MNHRLQTAFLLLLAAPAASALTCEEAWAEYNAFKERNVMEESQYPLTVQGAAVRGACGAAALPVPPGSDTPHRPVVRKQHKPQPQPPAPGKQTEKEKAPSKN